MEELERFFGNIKEAPKGGFASEETLSDLVSALKIEKIKDGGAAGKKIKAENQAGKSAGVLGQKITKINPALTALEVGFNALGSAISGASGLLSSVFQMDGSFSSLSGVVDYAADMINNTFGNIPIIGGFITASALATAAVTKLQLTLMDLRKDTFQSLADSGFNLSTNLNGLIETVLSANIGVDQFNRIVTQNADGLRVFGGTINSAATKFTKQLVELTDDKSEVGMSLRLLGLGSTDIAEELSDFITSNRNNSFMMNMDADNLNKAMLSRIKNERVIAQITGKSAEEQRRAQMELANDAAFQATLMSFPAETRAQFTDLVSTFEGPVGDAIQQFMNFGNVTSEQTAMLASAAPGLMEEISTQVGLLKSGAIDADSAVASILQVGVQNKDQITNLAKLGMIAPEFVSALGPLFLQITRSEAQLSTFANASKVAGMTITNQEELTAALNKQYSEQMGVAKELTDSGKELTVANLEAAYKKTKGVEIDKDTAQLIVDAANLEDLTGDIQKTAFNTLTEDLDGLGDIAVRLADAFGDILKEAGIDVTKMNLEAETGQEFDISKLYILPEDGKGKFEDIYIGKTDGKTYDSKGREIDAKNNFLGGSISSGMLSMVGEAGPELMRFGRGGEIINNATTNDIMSAASGIVQAMQEVKAYGQPVTETAVQAMVKANNPLATAQGTTLEDINNTLRTIASIDQQTLRQIQRQTKFEY